MDSELDRSRLSHKNPLLTALSKSLFPDSGEAAQAAGRAHFNLDGSAGGHPIIWMQAVSPLASSATVVAAPGSAARAILSEIFVAAERLLAQGEGSSIDVRFLKSTPEERAILLNLLGRGEVSAVVDSIGRSEIQETAIPCVWWVRHLNSDDETVGELIEIADIPELLLSDREAIATSLAALRARQLAAAC